MKSIFDSRRSILITGASGFMGAHLAKHYLARGYEVISILHDEKPVTTSKLLGIHDRITWCKGDIQDECFVKRVVADYEVDEIAHLAALPIVRVGTRTTTPIFQANVTGTINVLEAAREQHLSGYPIKFLYVSSDKAYGDAGPRPYNEEMPLSGMNVYDCSKAMGDLVSRCYSHSFNIPISVVRCCNVYGPADTNSRLIPNSIKRCLKCESPIIFRDIIYVREFIYVDDTCEAMMIILDHIEKTKGRAYNVGTGDRMDQKECINHILKFFPNLKAEYKDPPNYTRVEIPYQCLDTSRIEEELGWRAKTSFSLGLKKTIEWYREHLSTLRRRL